MWSTWCSVLIRYWISPNVSTNRRISTARVGSWGVSMTTGPAEVTTKLGLHQALADLVADAERDPGRIGPAAPEILTSLRSMLELPVFPQSNEASELLKLVRQDGQVTPAFRDAAIPVLLPLVR